MTKPGLPSLWWFVALGLIDAAVAADLLKPVNGSPRDLTLSGDAVHGAYVMRLAGCLTCHTDQQRNGPALAGGAGLKTPFGIFYPPNITPDKETGIGGWSLAQFSDAVSNGMGPKGNLYPVFPYNDLTLMSDQDLVDLYAAIMAVPPVSHVAPSNEVSFPFNLRLLVSGWKNLFFSPHRYQPDPSHSASWNRGAYLANGLTHCVACHSPLNALGAVKAGELYAGSSANAPGGKAPPLTVLALVQDGYSMGSLAQFLKTGMTPNAGKVGAEMGLVISDETSQWNDDDRAAVAGYLLNRP
jgi:mono/diheme cytochrome c family protein